MSLTPALTRVRLIALVLALVGSTLLLAVPGGARAEAPEITAIGVAHAGYYPDRPFPATVEEQEPARLGAAMGRPLSLVGLFLDVNFTLTHARPGYDDASYQLEGIWSNQATPFVNVKAPGTAADLAAGTQDAAIRAWAGYVKAWLDRGEGRSLILAPLQEMNWSGREPYQCDPANFKVAYRKFVAAFRDLGVGSDQIRFAFAPNGATARGCGSMVDYYPGPDVVDFVAFSAFNWHGYYGPDTSAVETFLAPFQEARTFAPEKPYIIAQTAACASNPNRPQFIADAFTMVSNDANAVGLVWFNIAIECDWRIFDGQSVDAGWAAAVQAGADYAHPISDWFHAGELRVHVPDSADLCRGGDCDSVGLVDGGARFGLRDRPTQLSGVTDFYFGNPGDYPLMGDWDCDGVTTPGQYRQSDGYVYLRNSNTSGVGEIRFFFGNPGDVPIVGDFNGNGCDTVSIYRPATGQFFIINRLGANEGGLGAAEVAFHFGDPGDNPFVGDFDGDGIDTVGLHRESTGLVYFRNSHTSGIADSQFIYGDPGDRILAGDWNGDGKDSVGLYRPGNGWVYLRATNSAGPADAAFLVGVGFTAIVLAPRA